jgi:two-component system, chemotaxis family, CheB/CheR fusion protein
MKKAGKENESLKSGNLKIQSSSIIDFPVVGIGASAGGLEALQEFFQVMPVNSGAAFVIVQHLSPDYKSLMNELLARYTKMTIHKVEDGMQVEENHIYLIQPRMNMTIYHGKLYLSEHMPTRTLNLPIDIFLRSLAKDQEKNAIAIILSGTGSDGTLGIRAIKEFGGMIMVQDDRSAKFDGMPRSSISTGIVDFILPPAKLAEELSTYIKHPFVKQKKQIENLLNKDMNQLAKVIAILRDSKGIDFKDYKENTIIRRLEKRISINRFENIEDYIKFLTSNNREINLLFNELLIGVTRFFRDEEAFKKVKTEIVAPLVQNAHARKEIRVWVAACSTGEEAYSLAILFREYMSENKINCDVKIFATDLDTVSLEFAGNGLYPDSIASDVTNDRISKYFIKRDNGYQINETIRGMIIFAKHNILQDPPFSKLDFISCRNMLIYINSDVQQRILSMFYLSLNDSGYLFLGSSESLGNVSEGFQVVDSKSKIFRQQKGFKPPHLPHFGLSSSIKTTSELKNISTYIKNTRPKTHVLDGVFDQILDDYVPPSVIIDENFDIVHTIHHVGKYVSLPVGKISLNLLKMLPRETGIIVNSLIRRAEKKTEAVVVENILSLEPDKTLSITCKRITNSRTGEYFFLVSFLEKEKKKRSQNIPLVEKFDINKQYQERIDELEKELQYKSESLQATVEELETSNEELQSSNEELIASNEELQSTNEELQSVNEELYTVNSEHIRKIEELTELYADIDNLLKYTQIGNLFLDRDLTIRKINDVASSLTNILQSDIGRPIQHLSMNSLYPHFLNDIYKVADTLKPIEKEIFNERKGWFLMQILPYRTAENSIEGIILTFVNVSRIKESQKFGEELTSKFSMAMDIGQLAWWEWDCEQNIVKSSSGKHEMLGYSADEIAPGFEGYTSLLHPDDLEKAMQSMRDHLQGISEFYEVEYRIRHKEGFYCWYFDKGMITERGTDGKPKKLMGVVLNNSDKKQLLKLYETEVSKSLLK